MENIAHNNCCPKYSQASFSLIEMAVVLLIGRILKGQELIEAAKLKAVNKYHLAVSAFMERYDGLPRDFNQARAYISGRFKRWKSQGCD